MFSNHALFVYTCLKETSSHACISIISMHINSWFLSCYDIYGRKLYMYWHSPGIFSASHFLIARKLLCENKICFIRDGLFLTKLTKQRFGFPRILVLFILKITTMITITKVITIIKGTRSTLIILWLKFFRFHLVSLRPSCPTNGADKFPSRHVVSKKWD